MESLKEKIPMIIAVVVAIAICVAILYFFENYESAYFTQIDNTKIEKLSSTDDMKYKYTLECYNENLQEKLTLETFNREKKEELLIHQSRLAGIGNISTNMITESIKEVFNNAKEFIVDNPNLFEHTIIYNKDTNIIESESVKEYYIDYLNYVNELGHKASNFLKLYDFELYAEFNKKMLFSSGARCIIDENNQLIKYNKGDFYKDTYKEKRASIIVDYGKRIYSLIDRCKDFIDDETLKALEFFSCSDGKNRKWYINSALYASNLYDEKIIPKYAQVHFYNVGQKDFETIFIASKYMDDYALKISLDPRDVLQKKESTVYKGCACRLYSTSDHPKQVRWFNFIGFQYLPHRNVGNSKYFEYISKS